MAVTINGTTGIVTPDIDVDGTTLVVDSANNRIGIGTDSPQVLLQLGSRTSTSPQGALDVVRGETIAGGTGPNIRLVHGPDGGTQRTHSIYSFVGDLRIAADSNENMELHTGGSLSQIINSDGNVGIGTDTPGAKLEVFDATSNTIINVKSGDSGAVLNLIDPSQRSSIEQNGTTLKIISDTGAEFANSDIRLQVDGATKMLIDDGGKVTITSGTNSGDAPSGGDNLLIKDNDGCGITVLSGDGNSSNIYLGSQTTEDAVRLEGFYNSGSPYFKIYTAGSERLLIDSTGDVRFAGTNLTNNTNKNVNLTAPSYNTSEEDVNLVQVENESGMNQISFGGGTSGLNAATTLRFLTASAVNITTGTERLRIDSSGIIKTPNLYGNNHREIHRHISGFSSGSSVVNYLLICETSRTNVRLAGRLFTSRASGTSATSAQLFDITFQTNHNATHQSGAIMGLHSGSNGYGHAEAEFVTLTYNSTDYFAIRFSSGWVTDFDTCSFDGIREHLGTELFTHIDSINETITNVSVLTASTYKGDVTIQQADLRISDGDIIMPSGHGISFSATSDGPSMTSEVLDDYEEGTWNPNGSYTFTHATYTKIGRQVFCQFSCATSPSGLGTISLPFTPSNNVTGSGLSEQVRYVGDVQFFVSGGNDDSIYKYIWQGNIGSSMYLHKLSGSGAQTWTATFGSNVSNVTVFISYIVA